MCIRDRYNIRPCTDINPPSVIRKGSSFQELSPHFLTLYYLVTAYSRADGVYKTAEDHRILFRAIQTFQKDVYKRQEFGTLDITINRSKPEKDPRDIAAAKVQKEMCIRDSLIVKSAIFFK